ncbi:MAG: adenylate/guanylate cyclase domain-containing protein [Alphaproteobacteria bacterium]|nr:adenylate/guanylate cyclase domain-containing protein [Alphaproteobacteria bacterium]
MKKARRGGFLLGIIIAALLTLLRWLDPQPLQDMRAASLDIYQRLKPRAATETPVTVVAIDEASLKAEGQWPWPRARLAELTDRLLASGAAAVGFDILFAEADRLSPAVIRRDLGISDPALLSALRDGDSGFAAAIAGKPVALAFTDAPGEGALPPLKAGFAVSGEEVASGVTRLGAAILPLPQLTEAASGLGHISLSGQQAGTTVRQVPLLLSDGGNLYPAFLLEALRLGAGASTYVVEGDPLYAGQMQSLRVAQFTVPTDEMGQLRFYAAPQASTPTFAAADVLGDKADLSKIEGSIVLVGVSAAGLQDIRVTPLGEAVPGVNIHAQLISQILAGDFLNRPAWVDGAEVLAIAALSLLLVTVATFVGPLAGLVAAAMMMAFIAGLCWYLFTTQGLLIDPVSPIGGALLTVFATTAFWYVVIERERRYIRQAFGRYVSPALLARIEQSPEALKLGGINREITVLFMDVRGFTSLSETLSPQDTIRFLNTVHGALSVPVVELDGTLDKYIGDSLMAFWNAPLDVGEHAAKAAEAALRMRDALQALNQTSAFGLPDGQQVRIGIGIHTGLACVGNFGTQSRLNYSAVGDTVNTAARIEAACKDFATDILVSGETARLIPHFRTRLAGEVHLRGKSHAEAVHYLDGRPPENDLA